MKTYLVTHTDLDGIGAAVLANKAIPNLYSVSYQDYPTIDAYLADLLQRKDIAPDDLLLITDISPNQNICQLLDEHANKTITIKLFDHHDSRKWVAKYPWATYNDKKSGTTLLYDELMQLDPQLNLYHEFAQAVEAWDTWKLESPFRTRGEVLHTLHKFIGMKDFVNTFAANPEADKEEPFVSMLRYVKQKKEKTIKAVVNAALEKPLLRIDSLGRMFIIVQATDYISEVADTVLSHPDYSDLQYVVVYNPVFEVCSLRSREANVGDLARRLNGGGHKNASGFPYYAKKIAEESIFKLINAVEF
jgi:oligoribonuclease NrnB/cAMP/cGMP phosphodiesterase (DHH superfamily)